MTEILGQNFYSVAETAEKLGVTPQTVRSYIKKQTLRGQRVGRGFYVSEQSLQEYLKLDTETAPDPDFTRRALLFFYGQKESASPELAAALESALNKWQKEPSLEIKVSILEAMVAILENKLEVVK